MRDILPDLDDWRADDDQSIALATVIQTWGSSPRRAGAKMALTPDGKITGSHIDVRAKVPGITSSQFETLAEKARTECPVSKALSIKTSVTAVIIDEKVETSTN